MNILEAYRILNLKSDSSIDMVRQSYLELSKKYHPDHNSDQIAHDMFVRIKEAYDYINNSPAQSPTQPDLWQSPLRPMSEGVVNFMRDLQDTMGHSPGLDKIKLATLQALCGKNHIDIYCLSPATQKPIKKTKGQLYSQIKKLPYFCELNKKSYDQLVEMCQEKNLEIAKTDRKSVLELIIAIMTLS